MKVLVIGKHGQLGAELIHALQKINAKVFAFGHKELDISQYQIVRDTIKKIIPDVVINTAAYHVLSDCELYPQKAFAINAFALKNLAEICAREHIQFITYSTDYVFDGAKGTPYKENDRPNPLQLYGVSKLAGEYICLNYNPGSMIIRTCGLYGGKNGSRQKGGNIVLNLLKEAKEKETMEVSCEQVVNPTYGYDLAECTVKLLQKKAKGGIYHLSNTGYCSWYEFACEIVKLEKLKTHIVPINRGGSFIGIKRPVFSALDTTKARSLHIVMPAWQDALKRYLTNRGT